jgi:hypothetical protein
MSAQLLCRYQAERALAQAPLPMHAAGTRYRKAGDDDDNQGFRIHH